MQTEVRTWVDATGHVLDWMGSGSTDLMTLRKAKSAVETAYREIATVRQWQCFETRGVLITNPSQTDGTITYDHTGGTYERLVTLASSTWPTWSKFGILRVSNTDYEVEDYKSTTEITLSVNSNPGEDLAAGTAYIFFRDTYPTPVNFQSIGPLRDVNLNLWPTFCSANQLLAIKRIGQPPTYPREYSIVSDPSYFGSLAFKFNPPPNDDFHYEYNYLRRPRSFGTYQYNTGTVTNSSTTLTGTGTTFTTNMIGCSIRFSSSTTAPTGTTGSNPFSEQRLITGWTSTTVMTLDQAPSATYTGVAYEISDPIELDSVAMYTAFLRRCEWEMGQLMNRDDTQRLFQQYKSAELIAFEADAKFTGGRPSRYMPGGRVPYRWTLASDFS